jgi:hypothetical protein
VQQKITNIADVCRSIYEETRSRYDRLLPRMAGAAHGFKILGGPPQDRPQIMFIGYQPGGSAENDDYERRLAIEEKWPEEWPPSAEFATAEWPLAVRMRSIFSTNSLQRSVSLNAIFLRFPNSGEYRRALDVRARRDLKAFCLASVREMVRIMQPARIIIIGLSTADLFGSYRPVLHGQRGQKLATGLAIEGVEATAIIHLTGARISGADFQLLRNFLTDANSRQYLAARTAKTAVSLPQARHSPVSLAVGPTQLAPHPNRPISAQRTGCYRIGNLNALQRRASNRQDPRSVFYDAMIKLDRLEGYYAKFGDLKVSPETHRSSPRTAHTEMAWARKLGRIVVD